VVRGCATLRGGFFRRAFAARIGLPRCSSVTSGANLKKEAHALVEKWCRRRPRLQIAVAWYTADSDVQTWQHACNEDALFEIGSITKCYTVALLAVLAERGIVALTDPIERHLELGSVANGELRGITLGQLATHTSGLPRVPPGLKQGMDRENPYAHLTEERVLASLARIRYRAPKKERIQYSNLGMGLLGQALAQAVGTSWYEGLRTHVLVPLGVLDTHHSVSASEQGRLVQGHTARGKPTAHWDFPAIAGAGALRSTAREVAMFMRSVAVHALGDGFRSPMQPHVKTRSLEIERGWFVAPAFRRHPAIHWHNGATGGFSSFAGFSHPHDFGVVVLANHGPSVLQLVVTGPPSGRLAASMLVR